MGSPRAPVLKVPCRQVEYVTLLYRCLTNWLAANCFLRLLGRYLAKSALSLNQLISQWIRPNSPPPIDYVCSRSQNADLILCQGLDFFKNQQPVPSIYLYGLPAGKNSNSSLPPTQPINIVVWQAIHKSL